MFESTLHKRKNHKDDLKPMKPEEFQKVVKWEIEQAVDFLESEISPVRQRAEIYYQGGTGIKHIPGRSKIVVTKVRDSIKSILPSIARIFCQSGRIAEFTSEDEEDEQLCKDATLYCNRIFWKFGGYQAFIEAVTCALKSRIGIVRVYHDKKEVATHELTGLLTQEELDLVDEDEDATLTEVGDIQHIPQDDGTTQPMREAVITRRIMRDHWDIECLAPEEFIVDSRCTRLKDARIFGIRRYDKIYNIIELGISYDDIIEGGISDVDGSMLDRERINRLNFEVTEDPPPEDPTARDCLICEVWVKVDADGDGIAELRHVIAVGEKYQIVKDEPVNYNPISIFKTELQANVFFPISLAEDSAQDQDAMTSLLRSILDNCALVNSPRTVINEQMVNLEDAKNNEIGAMIRARAMKQIEELITPFVAGETLPVLQTLSDNADARTGVTKLSQGVDADALQSTSRVAANGIQNAADARIEMMARNIAETGVKDLFMSILRCAIYDKKGTARVREDDNTGYRDIDTSYWHDQLVVEPKVGLGNGKIDEKKQILAMVAQDQKIAIQTFGLANPISGYPQLRNTYKDLLRLHGVHNVNDYFPNVPLQVLQQIDQQRAQAAKEANQKAGTPPEAIIEAEKIKGQVKLATTSAELQQKGKLKLVELQQKGQIEEKQLALRVGADMQKAVMEDDRQRDKQDADFAIQSEKVQLDDETKRVVGLEQAKNRAIPKAPK